VIVVGLVVFALRNRETTRPGAPARFIAIGGIAAPVAILAMVAVATVSTTAATQGERGVIRIDVEAEQFWWRLSYPDSKVMTANEIHVPVGLPVELRLRSDGVIHSVWVPQLDGKVDVIPGQTNTMTFTAEKPGTYRGQCAEFCGIGHALMAFDVVAQTPLDFESWLRRNSAPAVAPHAADAIAGAQLLATSSCGGCHRVAGTAADGTLGPDLTHFGSRSSIAAGTLPNDSDHLALWLAHTQSVKPGAKMPQIDLTQQQIDELVAYLEGLS
jgi:cytochrome c oxidase subunit 2